MPCHAAFFPLIEPLHLRAGAHKELHLHLLKLTCAEDELAGHDLIAEGLADLRNTKGDTLAGGVEHIEEVDKDALCGLGAEVDGLRLIGYRADLRGEHEI